MLHPGYNVVGEGKNYVLFFNNKERILPIARVGFNPLGHTETQFIILRQRNTLNGSPRSAIRSSDAVSRLSIKNRYAHSNPAGPINFSGFHQKDGHCVEQHAHKIHSYNPSKCSRCWMLCYY